MPAGRLGTLTGRLAELARSGAYARSLFWSAARRFTPVVGAQTSAARYLVSTRDGVVGRQLFVRGAYDDAALAQRVRETLAARGWPPAWQAERTVVDVGANIGTASIEMVARGFFAGALAIEPDPANVALLSANVAVNGLAERIEVLGAAISSEPGEVRLARSPDNPADHRVRLDGPGAGTAFGEGGWDTIVVPCTTLDRLVEEGRIEPERTALVWIDAQGHEPHILAAAEALIGAGVPILCEYWPYGLSAAGVLERFEELVQERFPRFVEIGGGGMDAPSARIAELRARYDGPFGFGDLLLLPR